MKASPRPSRAARVRDRIEQLQLLSTFEKNLAKSISTILSSQIRTLADKYRTLHHINAQMLVSHNAVLKTTLTVTYKRVCATFAARIRKLHGKTFETAIRDWITNRALSTITNIDATTLSTIQTIIKNGVFNGLGTDAIARQIEDEADDVMFDDADTSTRAWVIARTEVHTAANYAGLQAAKETGVATSKTWTASLDNRTREAHQDADGQTVAIDDPFDIDGEEIDHPGDGSPENAINCRCVLIYSTGSPDESEDD